MDTVVLELLRKKGKEHYRLGLYHALFLAKMYRNTGSDLPALIKQLEREVEAKTKELTNDQ